MISSPASFSISYNMTTIKELTSIMINQHSTAIASASLDINKDLIRLLAAEYKFDAVDAIKRFLVEPDDDNVVSIPKPSKKPKKSKKPKDPNKPKKPSSSFLLFASAKRAEVKAEHPEYKSTQIQQELGKLWGLLSDEDKQPFEEQNAVLKEKYNVAMKAYNESKELDSFSEED